MKRFITTALLLLALCALTSSTTGCQRRPLDDVLIGAPLAEGDIAAAQRAYGEPFEEVFSIVASEDVPEYIWQRAYPGATWGAAMSVLERVRVNKWDPKTEKAAAWWWAREYQNKAHLYYEDVEKLVEDNEKLIRTHSASAIRITAKKLETKPYGTFLTFTVDPSAVVPLSSVEFDYKVKKNNETLCRGYATTVGDCLTALAYISDYSGWKLDECTVETDITAAYDDDGVPLNKTIDELPASLVRLIYDNDLHERRPLTLSPFYDDVIAEAVDTTYVPRHTYMESARRKYFENTYGAAATFIDEKILDEKAYSNEGEAIFYKMTWPQQPRNPENKNELRKLKGLHAELY